jgi:hypothetical protein
VHNLEHGGVVVVYRCAADCAATRQRLVDFVRGLPAEPRCVGTGVSRRIVLTEDPLLGVPVGAAAWGWTWRGGCADLASLRQFVLERTGQAPEDFCDEGSFP